MLIYGSKVEAMNANEHEADKEDQDKEIRFAMPNGTDQVNEPDSQARGSYEKIEIRPYDNID